MTFSTEDEAAIQAIANLMVRHIDRQASTPKKRDQHPKQHGCLRAKFCIEPYLWEQLPEPYRVGLWQQPQTYDAWVRFSNFQDHDDAKGDVHGMAIKVLPPESTHASSDPGIQDFVLLDSPVFFMNDVQPYLELFQILDLVAAFKDPAAVNPPATNKLTLLFQLLCQIRTFLFPSAQANTWRLREVGILIRAKVSKKIHKISSPLDQTYWSTTPYKIGAENVAVKYIVRPSVANHTPKPKRYTANYLREALSERLTRQRETARFDFYVQVKSNPTPKDLNDTTTEWRNAPEFKIATLIIPPQDFYPDQQPAFGETFAFTPWHCLPEHEPLGTINHIRKKVYQLTAQRRNTLNAPDMAVVTSKPPQELPLRSPSEQHPLTVIVPIRTGAVDALRDTLEHIGAAVHTPNNPYFAQSPSTHLARWVILDAPEQDVPPHLLFSCCYDGPFTDYMQELVNTIGSQMDPVWQHCVGYTPNLCRDVEVFTRFIHDHSYAAQAFYVGCRGVSVQDIRNAKTLRQQIDTLAQTHAAALAPPLTAMAPLVPARSPDPGLPAWLLPWLPRLRKISLFGQPFVGIFPKINNPSQRYRPESSQISRVADCSQREDQLVGNDYLPNPMTTLSPIKSRFHKNLLKVVLWLVNKVSQVSRGTLVSIGSIHFARWVIVEPSQISDSRSAYLIFESNYRGSVDSYLDDFVYKTLIPMNLIWGNLTEFPVGGCHDMEMFKQHQRPRHFPAQVFYCAYPDLSVQNILCDRTLAQAVGNIQDYLSGAYCTLLSTPDHWLMNIVRRIAK